MLQKIKLPRKISRRYPAYELYLYGEGSYAEENRNLMLSGIPVLFLPGNAGSYKQGNMSPKEYWYIPLKVYWYMSS